MELQLTLYIRINIAIGPWYNKYLKLAQAGCDFLVRLFRVTGCSLPPTTVRLKPTLLLLLLLLLLH